MKIGDDFDDFDDFDDQKIEVSCESPGKHIAKDIMP